MPMPGAAILRLKVTVLIAAVALAGLVPGARIAGQDLDGLDDPEAVVEDCWPDEEADTSAGYPQWSEPPELVIDDSGDTAYRATFVTNEEGTFSVDLLPEEAPETVNNFVCLALAGFYDGTIFHRVVPEFVIQGGDPTGTGMGGPGYEFDDEPIERDYRTGTLAMANAGPDTNGSQFFVVLEGGAGSLEPLYTIFGEVEDELSQEVVEDIGESDPADEPITLETIRFDTSDGRGAEDVGNIAVEGDDYAGVIFSEENAPELVGSLYGPSAAEDLEYWTPDEDDVEDLEDEIEDFLEDAAEDGDVGEDVVEGLPEYGRQYAGIVEDGDELILANFFCDGGSNPETIPVVVADGGDCFFRVTYDVDEEEFSDLEVNGEA
jgi:cyclophilin family peptidyl-prolyl cis-trans isomerase